MFKSNKTIKNKRIAVFNNSYELRMGLTINPGDEFVLGTGFDEYMLDDEGNLVLFVGEFTPHRVKASNFRIEDEIVITTVETHRKIVK